MAKILEVPKPRLYKHYSEVPRDAWRWDSFSPKEIACHGTGEILIDFDALDRLQTFRDIIGVPFTPNSAYRSIEHNKTIGGSPKSQHCYGRAFDVPVFNNKMSRDTIKKVARIVGFKGIGDYNTFVHIDTGPARYWDNRT